MCNDPERFGGQAALANLAEMFGRWAIWIVPVLLIAGTLYAVMLVGSVAALVTTPYGQVLMVKAGLVGGLLGLAALNKFRLVPALRRGETAAMRLLQRQLFDGGARHPVENAGQRRVNRQQGRAGAGGLSWP